MAGIGLTPGAEFWALLPVFVIIPLVVAVKNSGDGVVIQQVSRRNPRALTRPRKAARRGAPSVRTISL